LIDAAATLSVLDARAPDSCLGHPGNGGGDAAACDCRLAEALFHRGDRDEALDYGRRAFAAAAADDRATADFCAWLFSNCGVHDAAAAAYQRLLALAPDWAEGHRHASGSLAASGDLGRAVTHARRASDLAPQQDEFALHAGCLMLSAGHCAEAAAYLQRAVTLRPDDSRAWRELSAAYWALDRRNEALALAFEAARRAPHDADAAIHAAELLLRCGRSEEAAMLVHDAAERLPDDVRVLRVLSAVEMLQDRIAAALAAIDRALVFAPGTAEYHLHRGHLLRRQGDAAGAAAAFDRAAQLDPNDSGARRARLDMLAEGGRMTEATALAGELLQSRPQDDAAAETVLHLLNRRLDTIDGDYVVLADRTSRPWPVRPMPSFGERLHSQCRVIHALVIRETRTRFGDARLGYGWALLEPILHIALLSAAFSLLMRGQPPIGAHFFIFYFTGLVPYLMFVHTSSAMSHAIPSNRALLQLPLVTTFDVIAARGLLEIVTDAIVAVILLVGFRLVGLAATPDDLWAPTMALLVTATFGCGIGFINAVLTVLCKPWDKVWPQLTRALYFCSGIFYVPGMMPDWARDALVWNPLLHAIDWFRAGFYAAYQPHWLDRSYLAIVAVVMLSAGIALERGLRPKLGQPL
jgi:ABC-type polysaccharide/polyol phosphate export permease/Flp pilus assembly protein TadD